jgi:hypothetical protein
MQSYQSFMPGNHFHSMKSLKYITSYNKNFMTNRKCTCIKPNKKTTGSGAASSGTSFKTRITQLITNNQGGTTHYGASYLGQPVNINYLGRKEGMPGGSGKPPTNF